MVTTNKTWFTSINNVFSTAVNQVTQYQEAFYFLKELFLAAGWTIVFTCDGTTADANDNLTSAASVTIGQDGISPISYFVVQCPSGWVSGGNTQILIYTDNLAADTTPQDYAVHATTGTYSLDASPLTNIPNASANEVTYLVKDLIPHAVAAPGRMHAWRTSSGDIFFGVSTDSTGVIEHGLIVWAPTPSVTPFNLEGNYRMAIFFDTNAAGAWKSSRLSTAANWRSFQNDATVVTSLIVDSFAFLLTSLTNGLSGVSGALQNFPISLGHNATDGRMIGIMEDIRCVPGNSQNGEVNDADTDATRYVVIDDLIIPTQNSQLPVVF